MLIKEVIITQGQLTILPQNQQHLKPVPGSALYLSCAQQSPAADRSSMFCWKLDSTLYHTLTMQCDGPWLAESRPLVIVKGLGTKGGAVVRSSCTKASFMRCDRL
jgi:hypothetical protein